MKWKNETLNQHFIPQVEQRFNAINPTASDKNQKIYAFEIVNREACELRQLNKKGHCISKTLAYDDLFSFDVEDVGSKIRSNFENAFNRYEKGIKSCTKNVLHPQHHGKNQLIFFRQT